MGIVKYVGLLFSRAAQKSVLLTDRLSILLVPFGTLAYWLLGADLDDAPEILALSVALTVVAVLALRLAAASYIVWREDQAKIAALQATITSQHFREQEIMNDHRLALRKELSDCLGWLITFAETRANVKDALGLYREGEITYAEKFSRAREIVSQLSYDVPLRVCCLNLLKITSSIAAEGVPRSADGKYPMLDRLWEQRKLTFKMLHRQDVNDLVTLAEIENLIAEHGEGFGDTSLADLRAMLKEHPNLANDPRLAQAALKGLSA